MVRFIRSILPLRCGVNAGQPVHVHAQRGEGVLDGARRRTPARGRCAPSPGTAPNGPRSGRGRSAIRSAVSTVPVCGVSAIAQPSSARVPSSMMLVSHGRRAGPLRRQHQHRQLLVVELPAPASRRVTGRRQVDTSPPGARPPQYVQTARSAGVSSRSNARCNVRSVTGCTPAQPYTRKSGTGAPATRPARTPPRPGPGPPRRCCRGSTRTPPGPPRSADTAPDRLRSGPVLPSHRHTVRRSTPSPDAAMRTCAVVNVPP